MRINIKDVNINYIQYGEGQDILLLHGWGQNINMMKPLGDNFSDKYRITILDLPGFGNSSEPPVSWNMTNYSDMLEEFVARVGINKPIVIGHSFGGRLAIRYSANNSIEKLVLFGAPCIRIQEKLPLGVRILKALKKLPLLNEFGEYMKQYDFLPDLNNKNVWQDPDKFIEWRKTQMLAFLKAQYDIVLKYKKQNDAE